MINDLYHKLLNEIMIKGYNYEDPNRKGVFRREIDSYNLEINLEDSFPAITTKRLFWKGVVGELLWFLRGSADIRELWHDNIHIWDKDWKNWVKNPHVEDMQKNPTRYPDYLFHMGNIYGVQWRNFNGMVDQFDRLFKNLHNAPYGTRHIITAWNPSELNNMALPPCHWAFEIIVYPYKTGGNGFTLKWHQRSVDTFLGLPFNIASYALLAHIIGKKARMTPVKLIGDLSNVHIYHEHKSAVKKQLDRNTKKFKSGKLKISDRVLDFIHTKDTNNLLASLNIRDFTLPDYDSFPAIKAEMLAINK